MVDIWTPEKRSEVMTKIRQRNTKPELILCSPLHKEGFLFLAVVMDIYARNIVGWSMFPRVAEDLVLDALTMAYWRRKPEGKVMLMDSLVCSQCFHRIASFGDLRREPVL